jgi:proteic killer suppression protein
VTSTLGIEKFAHRKQDVYYRRMIQTFANTETENFFATGKSRRLPSEILKRAAMRLNQLHAASELNDLRLPPSNHLEGLSGNRMGQWSIRINQQWRVCFKFDNGDAFNVEIVDYH